jgi:hypothetical protein
LPLGVVAFNPDRLAGAEACPHSCDEDELRNVFTSQNHQERKLIFVTRRFIKGEVFKYPGILKNIFGQ